MSVYELQILFFFKFFVQFQFLIRQLYMLNGINPFRHFKPIFCRHTDAYIRNFIIYRLFGFLFRLVTENRGLITFIGKKISLPVTAYRSAESFAAVKQIYLTPQIYQSVRCRCACKSDYSFRQCYVFFQCLKSLRL